MEDKLPQNEPRLESILIGSREIDLRVHEMAREIKDDFSEGLCLVGVLKGASVFMVDLARALSLEGVRGITFAFVRASTYGDGIKGENESGRYVKLDMLGTKIQSPNILILDDILDQGITLPSIKDRIKAEYPDAKIRTGVLLVKELEKPSPMREKFQPDYVGFTVQDRWVVGYGLDAGELFRELPYIAIANEKMF